MKLDLLLELTKLKLSEGRDVFKDAVDLSFDPDRTDPHDVAWGIMPLIVKCAYSEFIGKRDQYNKSRHIADPKEVESGDDEDDPEFQFTESELIDVVESWTRGVASVLSEMSQQNLKHHIEMVQDSFPEKLAEPVKKKK